MNCAMKKVLLCLLGLSLSAVAFAQKKAAFFISPEANFGAPVGETALEISEYTGFLTDLSRMESLASVRNMAKWAYGGGVTGGLVLWDQLYLSTGIRYQRRQDRGILYCHICDFFPIMTSPEKIRLDHLEIPLAARLDLAKGEGLRPFISGEGFWSHTLGQQEMAFFGPISIQQWGCRLGAGLAYPLGAGMQVDFRFFYERELDWGERYPHYHYQVLGFAVGLVKKGIAGG